MRPVGRRLQRGTTCTVYLGLTWLALSRHGRLAGYPTRIAVFCLCFSSIDESLVLCDAVWFRSQAVSEQYTSTIAHVCSSAPLPLTVAQCYFHQCITSNIRYAVIGINAQIRDSSNASPR
jgi:hypothetical protein